MDDLGVSGASAVTKKRRTVTSRRPRSDTQLVSEVHDYSTPSSTPSSDDASRISLEDNGKSYRANSLRRLDHDFEDTVRKTASVNKIEGIVSLNKSKKDDKRFGKIEELYKSSSSRGGLCGNSDQSQSGCVAKRSSEGVLAPANWKSSNKVKGNNHNVGQSTGDLHGSSENKLSKVRLKVGGVVRTIHAKPNFENENTGSSMHSRSSDSSRNQQKLNVKDNLDHNNLRSGKGSDLQPIGTDEHKYGSITRDPRYRKEADNADKTENISFAKPVRTSKRVPKRRLLDDAYDSGIEDEEVRHHDKFKTSAASIVNSDDIEEDGDDTFKKKRTSKSLKPPRSVYDVDEDYGLSRSGKESRKKLRSLKEPNGREHVEEEQSKKESVDLSVNVRTEPLTTRQRALQSGKGADESGVEFPNGLIHPPRKQKDTLSEVERLAKKAEAAQRRRMQVEKQERETQAEAIRKILGQDSSRKKKEEKLRQEQDVMAQKRKAESMTLKPNTTRWVMGPTGTVLTFADDIGLPSIFAKQCSYPPPREKCAGPSCTNAYKYRDSKSNLPLCSLQCYRAIQDSDRPVSTC